jgi:nucleotide-binding universal stress UspA family protein
MSACADTVAIDASSAQADDSFWPRIHSPGPRRNFNSPQAFQSLAYRHYLEREKTTMLPLKKILCPTDFSEPSLAALATACELAKHFNAELHILHVLPFTPPFPSDMVVVAASSYYPSDSERTQEAHRQLADLIAQRVPDGVNALPVVKMGQAAHEIICAADDDNVDVIVIGTHGATGWRHLAFGSVAEKVVRMAHRPVLTVHGAPIPQREGTTPVEESTPATA